MQSSPLLALPCHPPTQPLLSVYELWYTSTADTAYIPAQYSASRVTRTVTLDKSKFSMIQMNAGWVTVAGLDASLRDFRPHVLTVRCGGAAGRQRLQQGLCVLGVPWPGVGRSSA